VASCVLCNADILWATIDGRRVALDGHEVGPGQERFAQIDGVWKPVARDASVHAFVKHDSTCPYKQR
jgi:hypothetical protein